MVLAHSDEADFRRIAAGAGASGPDAGVDGA